MDYLLAYDVATDSPAGRRRLRRVAKTCESFGVRVQKSVFELVLDAHELPDLLDRVTAEINPDEDNVRVYRLSASTPFAVLGKNQPITTRGPLVL